MFPEWTELDRELAELSDEHCGELMKQSGCGCEWQWQKKLRQANLEKLIYEGERG